MSYNQWVAKLRAVLIKHVPLRRTHCPVQAAAARCGAAAPGAPPAVAPAQPRPAHARHAAQRAERQPGRPQRQRALRTRAAAGSGRAALAGSPPLPAGRRQPHVGCRQWWRAAAGVSRGACQPQQPEQREQRRQHVGAWPVRRHQRQCAAARRAGAGAWASGTQCCCSGPGGAWAAAAQRTPAAPSEEPQVRATRRLVLMPMLMRISVCFKACCASD